MKILLLSLLLLTACGKKGDQAVEIACGTKSLMSVWTRKDMSASIDLSNVSLGNEQGFVVTRSDGRKCSGVSRAEGSVCAGTYVLKNMIYQGPPANDPGCSLLNETGTFSKSDSGLRFCKDGGSCNDYQ